MIDLSNLKAPVGSLVVDAALVIALVIWGTNATTAMSALGARMDKVEQAVSVNTIYYERLVKAEADLNANTNRDKELKADIVDRLRRIEDKLDK